MARGGLHGKRNYFQENTILQNVMRKKGRIEAKKRAKELRIQELRKHLLMIKLNKLNGEK